MSTTIRWSRTESARRDPIKAHGVHFTPPELARFLARHALSFLPSAGDHTILDPACGDGELLAALLDIVDASQRAAFHLVGVDRDPAAVAATQKRLAGHPEAQIEVHQADFLGNRNADGYRQSGLFDAPRAVEQFPSPVDLIISNPPYVRTQVLGAETAKKLAADYELTGRVDLYHAFVRGMTDHLKDEGILGLLCSNRFLTTQGGAALREMLWCNYELCEIIDLGDTKLFAAAVLPAIIIARKRRGLRTQHSSFLRTYELRDPDSAAGDIPAYPSILSAIEAGAEGLIRTQSLTYEIEKGTLQSLGISTDPWTMTSSTIADWLSTVERHTACTFADVGSIRVGLKTTADNVFIRKDWSSLPTDHQPEAELIHPLLTHYVADQWTRKGADTRSVLYPHEVVNGKRRAIDLERYPRARAYLESHRESLAARTYVTEGGRKWYEIWVPQNPADWAKPKIVFPDISEKPRFFLDTTGAIVNGDCYWITVEDKLDIAYLMLAVANSTFAVKFYDSVCANRLYAGRRRFITQYVNRFPIPQATGPQQSFVRAKIDELATLPSDSPARLAIETELDNWVWAAFGFSKEVRGKRYL